ncbi:MAG: hypothetical protein J7494_06610 [Sphingobium sp.]|nr:hypothetical protein [Sphingobium sp.]
MMHGKVMRLVLAGAVASTVMAMGPAAAQPKAAPKDYAALAKLPDWSTGVWYPDFSKLFRNRQPGAGAPAGPPYTPEAAKAVADFNAKRKEGENLQTEDANCVPPGMPRMMQMPYPVEFLFTPGRVTILAEAYMQVRRIYTDGRKNSDDPDPQFNGNSVGHWEGDTLVVETVGLDPKTTLMTAIHPTEKTKIVERIRRTDATTLMDEMEITDPTLFTAPYKTSIAFSAKPDWNIREYICEENNRDAADPFGRPSMDLGLDDKKK